MSEETPASNNPAPAQPAAPVAGAAQAVAEKPAAPEAPKEPPFNIDALLQATSRYTRKAWNVILELRDDLTALRAASGEGFPSAWASSS